MRSLRAYLIAMVTTLVLGLSIGAGLLLLQIEHSARVRAESQLLENARALTSALDGELRRATGVLETLRASAAVQRDQWGEVDRQAREAFHDAAAWIVLADRSGRQLVNTRLPQGAPLPLGRYPPEAWREIAGGQPRVCNLTHGSVIRDIICVDVPIIRQGHVAYVLSMIMEPRYFERIMARQHLSEGRIATLLDRKGIVIWRNIHPLLHLGKPGTSDMLAAIRRSNSGVLYSRSLDGVDMVAAFARSESSGWTFIAGVPAAAMRAGFDRAAVIGLWGALGCLVLAGAAALLVTRRVSQAVAGLAKAAERFRDRTPTRFAPSGLQEIDSVGIVLEEAFSAREASDERFALAQEVGGIGAWDWDVVADRGTVTDTYKEMHGLSHINGALCLADVLAVIHPDDIELYQRRLSAARNRAEASNNEYRVVHPDGSIRWIAAKGRPMRDPDGRYLRAVGIVRDITVEREAQRDLESLNEELESRIEERTRQLAESERRFRAIFDTTFQLTGLSTLAGDWLVLNQSALDAVQVAMVEVVGKKIWDSPWWANDPDEADRVRDAIGKVAQGGFVRYEAALRLPGGLRQFDFSMKPVLDENGTPIFLVAEGRDITALKQTQSALLQSQKLEGMGQLTGGVAHDFNNLLTPILGSLDLLNRRSVGGEREQRLVASALQSAEKARTLVQRLLAFARRQPLQATTVDAAALVHGISGLLASTLGPRISLELRIPPRVAPIHADANQIELAILNLAVNARDAMPDGGTLTISVRSDGAENESRTQLPEGQYVVLCVADTGTGMDEQTARRATEPFFSTKGVGQGTGLGLSMVHGLTGQLGGALVIDSTPGEGTAVHLWLPVAREPLSAREQEATLSNEPHSGKVLLVDDDDLVRASATAMLAEIGYVVLEVASAEEAMACLEEGLQVDVLVTDYLMPGASGGELARWVLQRWPHVRTLVVTGYAGESAQTQGLMLLTKPFRKEELAAALARL